MEHPRLIEPNVVNYLQNTLHSCHENRTKIYYIGLNMGILILFAIIMGLSLYYCYTKKKSPYELHQKMIKDQEYILSKIRFHQSSKQQMDANTLTNLPRLNH